MSHLKTKLVHIYGFAVNKGDDKIILKRPAKLFKLNFYGSNNDSNDQMHYIGIQIGEEANPFEKLCVAQTGEFRMSIVEPSEEVVETMYKLYQNKDLKCHSFLTDVYTSHYYDGTIMIGYFFSSQRNFELNLDKDNDDYTDPRDVELSEIVTGDLENVQIENVAHSIQYGLGEYFVGKQIGRDFVNFEFSHEDDPGNNFYKICTESHDVDDYVDFNLTFKSGWISSNKVIAFVPTMCYCCT